MNQRAELFQKFIDESKIQGFSAEEPKDNTQHLALFRSNIRVEGNTLPFAVFIDDTPFAMIRMVIVPEAIHDDNGSAVNKLMNTLNAKYKPYKFYLDGANNLMAESCILIRDGEDMVGNLIQFVLNLFIQDVSKEYKDIMKSVWGK
jgi:hypothetical protein